MEKKIFLGGLGGQGVVFGGKLLAQAAVNAGKYATSYSEYAPSMRNGYTYSTIMVSNEPVSAQVCERFDCMVFFDETALATQGHRLGAEGTCLLNSSLVKSRPADPAKGVFTLAAHQTADELGDERLVNILLLGGVAELTGALTLAELEAQLERTFGKKPAVAQKNIEALRLGAERVRRQKTS